MANHLTAVVNHTPVTFQLYNWIAGGTTQADNVVIVANATTKTGGKDNDYINIPDANPVLEYFCLNNTAFTSPAFNLFLYEYNSFVYYTQNGPPSPNNLGTVIPESNTFTSAQLSMSQQPNGQLTLLMTES